MLIVCSSSMSQMGKKVEEKKKRADRDGGTEMERTPTQTQ